MTGLLTQASVLNVLLVSKGPEVNKESWETQESREAWATEAQRDPKETEDSRVSGHQHTCRAVNLDRLLPGVDFRTIPAPPGMGTPLKSVLVMWPRP